MKPNARIHSLLLAGFAVLLAACQYGSTVAPPSTQLEQNPLPVSQVESPVPTAMDSLDAVSAYHVTLHREVRYAQPDGSTFPSITEYNESWTRTQDQHGFNAHSVTTILDPQSGIPGVMDESYVVDDLAFTLCQTCPGAADQGGWSVSKRSEGSMADSAARLAMDSVAHIAGIPLAELVAQSVVVGDENISGISTTHYRLTDVQALSEIIRMQMGGAPNTPLDVTMAEIDTWVTVRDGQPIQYTFQAEGRTETIAGSQLLQPFTIQERYSVTEINSNMIITVPTTVLTAVASELERLNDQ